jgi:hypothetical protein
MDGIAAMPLLRQEAWLDDVNTIQKRLSVLDASEPLQLFNDWLDAIWAYRSWVIETPLTRDQICDLRNHICDEYLDDEEDDDDN